MGHLAGDITVKVVISITKMKKPMKSSTMYKGLQKMYLSHFHGWAAYFGFMERYHQYESNIM